MYFCIHIFISNVIRKADDLYLKGTFSFFNLLLTSLTAFNVFQCKNSFHKIFLKVGVAPLK